MAERLRGRAGVARRSRILLRDRFICQLCGLIQAPAGLRVDHTKPLAKGGEDVEANLRALCVPCHDRVTREEFELRDRVEVVGTDADGWPTA